MSEKMFGSTIEKRRPTPDKLEKERVDKLASALGLMRQILDEFARTEFTLEDLEESRSDIDTGDLEFLLDNEMLFFDEETEEYSVNHDSPHVAEMEAENDPDQEKEWGNN